MGIEQFIVDFVEFANNVVLPFLIGLAFLFFVVNAFRFFIVGGANEAGRENARSLAMYSILAFVFILVFWGLVNMFAQSTGLDVYGPQVSDYVELSCTATPGNGICECDLETPPDC